MIEPTPVYLDPGFDHDAIERELDAQLGIDPKPKRERAWDCLAGEVELVCGHHRIERLELHGRNQVTCIICGHEWVEHSGVLEVA